MKTHVMGITIIVGMLLSIDTISYASWGWESTDDPRPYYQQEWGKWYNYDETKVFMVQIDDKTYKYIFDYNGNFINGWMTAMPMRLN